MAIRFLDVHVSSSVRRRAVFATPLCASFAPLRSQIGHRLRALRAPICAQLSPQWRFDLAQALRQVQPHMRVRLGCFVWAKRATDGRLCVSGVRALRVTIARAERRSNRTRDWYFGRA